MSHRFVWVDIPVHDMDRAIAFYAAVLGTPVSREGGAGFSFGLLAHSGSDVAGCLYLADDEQRAFAARSARLSQRRRPPRRRRARRDGAGRPRPAGAARRSAGTAIDRSSSTAKAIASPCIRRRSTLCLTP